MQLRLSIRRHDADATADVRFDGVGGTLGRADDNDVVLEDASKTISRLHARIAYREGRYVYADVGTNPSLVNERPLGQGREHVLADGDRIAVGDYLLRVQLTAAMEGPDAASPGGAMAQPDALGIAAPLLADAQAMPPDLIGAAAPPDALAGASILRGDPLAAMDSDPLGLGACAGVAAAPYPDRCDDVGPQAQPLPEMRIADAACGGAIPADYDPLADLMQPVAASAAAAEPQSAPRASGGAFTSPPAASAEACAPAGDPVLEALLRGLGVPQLVTGLPAAELAEQIGAMLRVATAGAMQALRARALAKRESHIEMTMIAAGANNPLKFFPDAPSALMQMLGRKSAAYMNPVQAFGNAFGDLRAHELAMMAGVRAALGSMLARFEPEAVAAAADAGAPLARLLPARRDARRWAAFVRQYRGMALGAGEEFQRLFTESFAPAYEEQMERIRERGAD